MAEYRDTQTALAARVRELEEELEGTSSREAELTLELQQLEAEHEELKLDLAHARGKPRARTLANTLTAVLVAPVLAFVTMISVLFLSSLVLPPGVGMYAAYPLGIAAAIWGGWRIRRGAF